MGWPAFHWNDFLIADNAFVVVPSDSTTFESSALYIWWAWNVYVDMKWVWTNIPFIWAVAWSFLPAAVTKVYSTNTTATNINRVY